MTSITHSFVSAKSDGGDATLVRPSDWNDEHVIDGTVGGTGPLAVTQYAPSTQANYTNTNGTLSDVDATNLSVTFIAPPSGAVIVRCEAAMYETTGNGGWCYLGVREGSTTIGVSRVLAPSAGATKCVASVVVTGLTPGSSHTYKMAFAEQSGGTLTLSAKNDAMGPAIIEVWDAMSGGNVLVGTRVVRGRVADGGTIVAGDGFSVANPATGRYDITFTTPFSSTPTIVVTTSPDTPFLNNGQYAQVEQDQTGASGARIWTADGTTGSARNCAFNFIAIETNTGADSNAPLASGVGDVGSFITTTNSTPQLVTGAQVTVVTGARRCHVSFNASAIAGYNTSGGFHEIWLYIDGAAFSGTYILIKPGNQYWNGSFSFDTNVLSAGSHTFEVRQAANGGGTHGIQGGARLAVHEIPNTTAPVNVGPPNELDYVEGTAGNPQSITATTAATAQTVVASNAVTYDGVTPIVIEFEAPVASPASSGNSEVYFQLWDDTAGTRLGYIAYTSNPTTGSNRDYKTIQGHRRLTPAAGTRVYSIRAHVNNAGQVYSGPGGQDQYTPAFLRITRAQLNGGAPPAVIAARAVNAGFSVPDSAWTGVNLSSTTYDARTIVSTVSSITRFTAPASGFFRVAAWGGYNANGTGSQRYTAIYKNGTLYSSQGGVANASTNGIPGLPVNDLVPVVAGDRVELWAYQDSGGSLSLSARMAVEFVT